MGNYEMINSGSLGETWDFLAGIPTTYYRNDDTYTINNDADTLWDVINTAMVNNHLATFATGTTTLFGLVPGHAYTVLGTFNFTDS